jgi:hypothetical protein
MDELFERRRPVVTIIDYMVNQFKKKSTNPMQCLPCIPRYTRHHIGEWRTNAVTDPILY